MNLSVPLAARKGFAGSLSKVLEVDPGSAPAVAGFDSFLEYICTPKRLMILETASPVVVVAADTVVEYIDSCWQSLLRLHLVWFK